MHAQSVHHLCTTVVSQSLVCSYQLIIRDAFRLPVIVYYVMQLLQFHLLLCVSMPNRWLKSNGDFWKNRKSTYGGHADQLCTLSTMQVKETLPVYPLVVVSTQRRNAHWLENFLSDHRSDKKNIPMLRIVDTQPHLLHLNAHSSVSILFCVLHAHTYKIKIVGASAFHQLWV